MWIIIFHNIQSLRPEVSRLRSAVDKAVSNREQYVDKFCSHLNKDITELSREVKDIKNEAQVNIFVTSLTVQNYYQQLLVLLLPTTVEPELYRIGASPYKGNIRIYVKQYFNIQQHLNFL